MLSKFGFLTVIQFHFLPLNVSRSPFKPYKYSIFVADLCKTLSRGRAKLVLKLITFLIYQELDSRNQTFEPSRLIIHKTINLHRALEEPYRWLLFPPLSMYVRTHTHFLLTHHLTTLRCWGVFIVRTSIISETVSINCGVEENHVNTFLPVWTM